jgi:hypothetical protein
MKKINILQLVDKNYYLTKMSRIRFHGMDAVAKLPNVVLLRWGNGYDGYDSNKSVSDNLDYLAEHGFKPDLIEIFKPSNYIDLKDVYIKKMIRYNEMFDIVLTCDEIEKNRIDIVICHHYNDYKYYSTLYNEWNTRLNYKIQISHIPHSAESSIFYDQKKDRPYDILLVGATHAQTKLGEHYPLRKRFFNMIQKGKFPSKYKVGVYSHVGGEHQDAYTDKYLKEFADVLNSTKMVLTCCGKPKSRFGKYIEIPMCGTSIVGDVYDDTKEDVNDLNSFLINVNIVMSDDEIVDTITYYLENEDKRLEKVNNGLEYCENYTQEKYAERFIKIITEYLNNTY